MRDICGGSQRVLGEGATLYCVCGRVWEGPQVVPLHDCSRHIVPVERVCKSLDNAMDVLMRKRQAALEQSQERRRVRWGKT